VEVGRATRETVLVLVAGLAFMCGLIHAGAAVDHFDELPLYTLTFGLLAATQMLWAGMVLRGASDRLLLAGGAFNLAIVGLWVLSRTVGVPIAPQAWAPESVGVADLMETVGEIVVVLAVWSVAFSTRLHLARRVSERIAPLLVLALFLLALFGVGAHAG
jgi:hypothetical protein